MKNGTIKNMVKDRGFGFIAVEGESEDIFFHSSSLPPGSFDGLNVGQAVEFDVEPDPRNPRRTRATNVKVTG